MSEQQLPPIVKRTFHQGEKAYHQKQSAKMNPYSKETQPELYDIWMQGYEGAKQREVMVVQQRLGVSLKAND